MAKGARELVFHGMRGAGHQPPGCLMTLGGVFLGVAAAGHLGQAVWSRENDLLGGFGLILPPGGVVLVLGAILAWTRPAPAALSGRSGELLDETGRRALRAMGRAGWIVLVTFAVGAWGALLPPPVKPHLVFLAAGIAAATTLVVLAHALLLGIRALRSGGARLLLRRVPIVQGQAFEARFRARRPLPPDGRVSVTLRCVEETFEVTTDGRGRHGTRNASIALHEETRAVGAREIEAGGREFDVRFVPPGGCPPTRLDAVSPVYWELLVRVERPGLDDVLIFLLPVVATA